MQRAADTSHLVHPDMPYRTPMTTVDPDFIDSRSLAYRKHQALHICPTELYPAYVVQYQDTVTVSDVTWTGLGDTMPACIAVRSRSWNAQMQCTAARTHSYAGARRHASRGVPMF